VRLLTLPSPSSPAGDGRTLRPRIPPRLDPRIKARGTFGQVSVLRGCPCSSSRRIIFLLFVFFAFWGSSPGRPPHGSAPPQGLHAGILRDSGRSPWPKPWANANSDTKESPDASFGWPTLALGRHENANDRLPRVVANARAADHAASATFPGAEPARAPPRWWNSWWGGIEMQVPPTPPRRTFHGTVFSSPDEQAARDRRRRPARAVTGEVK